jgi:hypothetical protein
LSLRGFDEMTWGEVFLICIMEIAFFLAIFKEYFEICHEEKIKEMEKRIDKLHEGMKATVTTDEESKGL